MYRQGMPLIVGEATFVDCHFTSDNFGDHSAMVESMVRHKYLADVLSAARTELQGWLGDRAAEVPWPRLAAPLLQEVQWRNHGEACKAEGMIFRATVNTVERLQQSLARAGAHEEGEVTRLLFQRLTTLL